MHYSLHWIRKRFHLLNNENDFPNIFARKVRVTKKYVYVSRIHAYILNILVYV